MAFATCVPTVLEKRRSLAVDAMIPDPIFTMLLRGRNGPVKE
jgi:hypothetical protein